MNVQYSSAHVRAPEMLILITEETEGGQPSKELSNKIFNAVSLHTGIHIFTIGRYFV